MLSYFANLNFSAIIHNPFVVFILRIVILLLIIKGVHFALDFFCKQTTKNLDNRKQTKQIHTIVVTIKSILDILIVSLCIIEMLPKLGIDIRPILTAAGVLGVAVGFGSKQLVEDVISGMTLILQGQIMVGDIIEIDGKLGIVEQLNLKMVVLRDWDGKVYYIRNGMINVVTNYTREYAFAIMEYPIAYNEDANRVMKIIEDLANNDLKKIFGKDIQDKIEVWGIDSFGDSSVNLKFRLKTNPMKQWAVKRELNRLVKNKFDELGIEIPFPQRVVHIEDKENVL